MSYMSYMAYTIWVTFCICYLAYMYHMRHVVLWKYTMLISGFHCQWEVNWTASSISTSCCSRWHQVPGTFWDYRKNRDESGEPGYDCLFPFHRHRSSGEKTQAKTQMGNNRCSWLFSSPLVVNGMCSHEKKLVHEMLWNVCRWLEEEPPPLLPRENTLHLIAREYAEEAFGNI